MVQLEQPREKTSWRSYGGIRTAADVDGEQRRIQQQLEQLKSDAEFPLEFLPLVTIRSRADMQRVAKSQADATLLFAASGWIDWVQPLLEIGKPLVLFLRHKSGPFYLWYEIAHWRFLRQNGDEAALPGVDAGDVVVDDNAEILWRLRGLYGLANARGTTMLAIGGLAAYSEPAQTNGPKCARDVWGYRIVEVTEEEFARRLNQWRQDADAVRRCEQQADALLSQPNVKLQTERRFVVNTFCALEVCKQWMRETGATNFGFAHCMGNSVIGMLDTPPCLLLSLANDEGDTAYCHTDLSHTMPGVLMRWIANRPTFLCNSHFPHDGIFTVAHCAAPRRMNGKDLEPISIMTHYESDYGAACRIEYPQDQSVTVVIPNLRCTKWQGFQGRIVECPAYPACRSQMEIAIDGDWKRLVVEMEGFHCQIVYGQYLREIGYALKKLGRTDWQSYSETV
jgi:hypothetical protein